LRGYVLRETTEAHVGATLKASEETGLAIGLFPEQPVFTPEQVLDPGFFPEDRSIE